MLWEKSGEDPSTIPAQETTYAIRNACRALRIEEEPLFYMIDLYANRNEKVHSDIKQYIAQCDRAALAAALEKDKAEIPRIIPVARSKEANMLLRCMNQIQDVYSESIDSQNPGAFITSKEADTLYQNLQEQKKHKPPPPPPPSPLSTPRMRQRRKRKVGKPEKKKGG